MLLYITCPTTNFCFAHHQLLILITKFLLPSSMSSSFSQKRGMTSFCGVKFHLMATCSGEVAEELSTLLVLFLGKLLLCCAVDYWYSIRVIVVVLIIILFMVDTLRGMMYCWSTLKIKRFELSFSCSILLDREPL